MSVDKDWKIYDARGRAKPVTDPAPVVHRLGLTAGKNVKSAKQLSVTSLAKLQQIDNFQLPPKWGNLYRIRAVAEASPPCMGKLLATAFTLPGIGSFKFTRLVMGYNRQLRPFKVISKESWTPEGRKEGWKEGRKEGRKE